MAFAILGVCTCVFGAGGSVIMYLQHCEPNSRCRNSEEEKVSKMWDEHHGNVLTESNAK